MVRVRGMLMVGAAGRNAGKTEFACSLLRRFGSTHRIIAVKVTAVDRTDGKCPRGGEGCGVCSALGAPFLLTEETDPPRGKDTGRLLEAGAAQVFWLRVRKKCLAQGLAALRERVGDGAILICESNSLRLVARPDVFLIVRESTSKQFKESARAVRKHADRIVLSDGRAFDLGADALELAEGRWRLRQKATAIILAGGRSRRMGRDKSRLEIAGKTLLEHIVEQLAPLFDEILLSTNDPPRTVPAGVRAVPDETPGAGPFVGVVSCLAESSNDLNFVVACDMPAIDVALVRKMLAKAAGNDGVVIKTGRHYEPLFAVYRKRLLPSARSLLAAGHLKIIDLYEQGRFHFMRFPRGAHKALLNLNTPEEFERFRRHRERTTRKA